jgi:integrase/recombinase XerC
VSKLALAARFQSYLENHERDILAELLADKRSLNTRRAYERDINDFFVTVLGEPPNPALVIEFLGLERFTAIALVLKYKAALIKKGLAEATVNRRLAALKSLVSFAQKAGKCLWSLEEIRGEKVTTYRDTSGVDVADYRKVLETCDRATPKGVRDYVILRLLWDNALREAEVCKLNHGDFNAADRTLRILGKGRGTQYETISLTDGCTAAIGAWVALNPGSPKAPIFTALSRNAIGHRLTTRAVYDIVRGRAEQAGLSKILSPHRCRHSSITAALDAGLDVRQVQKLSRHRKLDTLLIYDDNRANVQGLVSDRLSDLLEF